MDYGTIVENAKAQLKDLMSKREAIDREILAVTKILEGAQIGAESPSKWNPSDPKFSLQTVPLAEQEPAKFADKVRMILRKSSTPLFPTEIRDRLESMGVEATSPKHLLIHVHKVLERLFDNDEVIQVEREGKTAYKLLSAVEQAMRHYINLASPDPLAGLATPSKKKKD